MLFTGPLPKPSRATIRILIPTYCALGDIGILILKMIWQPVHNKIRDTYSNCQGFCQGNKKNQSQNVRRGIKSPLLQEYLKLGGTYVENSSILNKRTKLRCRSKAWHQQNNWHWSIVFTSRYLSRTPTWARCDVFGYQDLKITNALQRVTKAAGKLNKFIDCRENRKYTKKWN